MLNNSFSSPAKMNEDSDKTKVEFPPFYKTATRYDTCRLPLLKPYELFSTFRGLKKPALVDTSDKKEKWFGRQICIIEKFNIINNYLTAKLILCNYGTTGLLDNVEVETKKTGYLILSLSKANMPELEIERDYAFGRRNFFGKKIKTCTNPPFYIYISYGTDVRKEKFTDYNAFIKRAEHFGFDPKGLSGNYNKIQISIPKEYKDCLFFGLDDFCRGLKKYSLPEKIKLYKPEYFYEKFVNTGYCHWFPGIKKKAGDKPAK